MSVAFHGRAANLPDDFQLQLALVKLPSMTNVANFVLPLQDINGNATWTPVRGRLHNMDHLLSLYSR